MEIKWKRTFSIQIDFLKTRINIRHPLWIGLLAFPVYGQDTGNPVLLKTMNQFHRHVQGHPREKVYLHLDKTQTTPGETIWFKAYLVDAASHTETAASSLVYVELIDPENRIVQTCHILTGPETGAGDFFIPRDSLPGNYTIRAYTQYMRNFDESFFYHQSIRVLNPYESLQDEKLGTTVIPISGQTPTSGEGRLSIQFFPEGGDLVEGISSRVAYKITDSKGKYKDVQITIFDQDGQMAATALSYGKGLGLFSLKPDPGKSYYAKCTSDGQEAKFPLPSVLRQGFGLQLNFKPEDESSLYLKTNIKDGLKGAFVIAHMQDRIVFTMEANSSAMEVRAPFSTKELPDGICRLTLFDAHGEPQCERLIFVQNPRNRINGLLQTDKAIYSIREEVRVDLDLSDFELEPVEANLSVAVLDRTAVPDQSGMENIESYLLLTSEFTEPLDPTIFFENSADQKMRQLQDLEMMTKGWRRFVWKQILEIEDPPPLQYEPEQGFTVAGMTTNLENNKKPLVADVFLSVLGADGVQMYDQRSGPDGYFQFSNLVFTDTTSLLLQANKFNPKKELARAQKKNPINQELMGPLGNRNVSILIINTSPPEIKWSPFDADHNQYLSSEYLADRRRINRIDSVYRNDWQIDLAEIQIKGRKPEKPKEDLFRTYYGTPSHRLILDSIHGIYGSMTIFDVIRGRVAGVQVFGSGFSQYAIIRGPSSLMGSNYAQIFLNGLSMDNESAAMLSIHDIAAIDVYKGAAAGLFGVRGAGGAIVIHTRSASDDDQGRYAGPDPNGILRLQHPGYYKAREFYSPNYTKPEPEHHKPDFRTTLYWNPQLNPTLPGQYSFNFFTCDKTVDYQMIVEGISRDGRPFYKKAIIQVR